MVTLCLGWMPSVHPFALEERGPAALRVARAAVEAVLDLPLRTKVAGPGDGGDGGSGPASRHAVVMARALALEGVTEVGGKRMRDGSGGLVRREEAGDSEAEAEGSSRKRAKAAAESESSAKKAVPDPVPGAKGGKAKKPTKRARRGRGKAGR